MTVTAQTSVTDGSSILSFQVLFRIARLHEALNTRAGNWNYSRHPIHADDPYRTGQVHVERLRQEGSHSE